ncbi:MAG TPA: hypothetical protein VK066_09210 [Chloroflexota bacterium]|nr:hypothetical protein [Chloroflexota bacterium]
MSNVSEYLRGLPPAQQRQVRERVTAAVLAVELCRRCVESPGAQSDTVSQFRQYLRQAVQALQTVDRGLPEDA